MADILTTADFTDVDAYYNIPDLKLDTQKKPLKGIINFAEIKFLIDYNLAVTEITSSTDLKEALKYFTFAEWLRSQMLEKTVNGASVQKTQVKGTPQFDITREINSRNMAIRLINKVTGSAWAELVPFVNY
jgi:hypothetical protein